MRIANRLAGACCTVILLLAVVGQGGAAPLPTAPLPPEMAAYRPGAVLVRFRPGADRLAQRRVLATLDAQPVRELAGLGVQVLAVAVGQEAAVAAALSRHPAVEYAELDHVAHAARTPNDPQWDQQWALPAIEAPAAWDLTVGDTEQVIAVLDSGIDLDHPDLAAKLWVNEGEIPDNGLDDDDNGCVDDVHGCHFYVDGNGDHRQDGSVQDPRGHGSHVAGIAAAATDNGVGIAGVSWGAQLMPVRVLYDSLIGFHSDIAAGIEYAADQGATVINLSLGGTPASQTLQEAVDYAHERGALLAAAAGNKGYQGQPVLYPAACEHVIAVAATDQADNRWYGSNRGPEIDLAAPGVGITSASAAGFYFQQDGTSVATPHVSGLAALLLSLQPWLTPDEVEELLGQSADDVNGATSPGWDEELGWGRINARRAVEAAAAGLDLTLSVEPDWLPPGGGQAQITAVLADGDGEGRPAGGGAAIAFASDGGVITPTLALTLGGLAAATLDFEGGAVGSSVIVTATFGSQTRSVLLPVLSPTATPTVTPTPTDTPTPTPTATSTPSPEPAGTQVYLPIGLAEYSAACARYEPNASIYDAHGPLVSGQAYFAYICPGDENDYYYYFDISTHNPITMDLTGIPDGADYDLFLYDRLAPGDEYIAYSREGGNTDEHIDYTPVVTGRYYTRVWPFDGYSQATPYRLVVVFQ